MLLSCFKQLRSISLELKANANVNISEALRVTLIDKACIQVLTGKRAATRRFPRTGIGKHILVRFIILKAMASFALYNYIIVSPRGHNIRRTKKRNYIENAIKVVHFRRIALLERKYTRRLRKSACMQIQRYTYVQSYHIFIQEP